MRFPWSLLSCSNSQSAGSGPSKNLPKDFVGYHIKKISTSSALLHHKVTWAVLSQEEGETAEGLTPASDVTPHH